jgi:hypothetical protein
MKVKENIKSEYSIKKVQRVLRMKSEKFEPTTFEVYKVTGPKGIKKFFSNRKDASEFVKKHTDTKMNIVDVFTEIKRIENIKLPIKTIQ